MEEERGADEARDQLSHTNITIGGFPTRAMAVLSFRLLPPLQKERVTPTHQTPHTQPCLPVGTAAFAGMLGEVHPTNLRLHNLLDLLLWNPSQPSVHGQELVCSEPLDQGIKLQHEQASKSASSHHHPMMVCPQQLLLTLFPSSYQPYSGFQVACHKKNNKKQ